MLLGSPTRLFPFLVEVFRPFLETSTRKGKSWSATQRCEREKARRAARGMTTGYSARRCRRAVAARWRDSCNRRTMRRRPPGGAGTGGPRGVAASPPGNAAGGACPPGNAAGGGGAEKIRGRPGSGREIGSAEPRRYPGKRAAWESHLPLRWAASSLDVRNSAAPDRVPAVRILWSRCGYHVQCLDKPTSLARSI